jgi:hypothetical protein
MKLLLFPEMIPEYDAAELKLVVSIRLLANEILALPESEVPFKLMLPEEELVVVRVAFKAMVPPYK